jgi:hypothetical protein
MQLTVKTLCLFGVFIHFKNLKNSFNYELFKRKRLEKGRHEGNRQP